MDWFGPEFIITIVAIGTFGGIVKTWIHARHGLPMEHGPHGHGKRRHRREQAGDTEEVQMLKSENARLTDRLEASEDRLAVLERIVTDKSYNLASEIEALRDQPARREDRGNVQ